MWATLAKMALQFIPKDRLILIVFGVPLAFIFLLMILITGPSVLYKHVPLGNEEHYQYYIQAAQRIHYETGVHVNWQEIMAIDAVVLEQDFSKSSYNWAFGYKKYFIREEVVEVECPRPIEDDEDKKDTIDNQRVSYCYETLYFPRSFNTVLQMLVNDGVLRIEQLEDVNDYLTFKITTSGTGDNFVVDINFEGELEFSEFIFAWPLPSNFSVITSSFGPRVHPITSQISDHAGIDISAPIGTSVYAIDSGEVIFTGSTENGGNQVHIRHQNGFVSKYLHLNSILVTRGQQVNRKDLIAYSGNTGLSSGPHLHLQIEMNGSPVNPLHYY